MRSIGHLADETAARTFSDYLYVQGIENQVDFEPQQGWTVWINDEDHLVRAGELLAEFRDDPKDPKYTSEGKAAADLKARKTKSDKAYRKKVHSRADLFRSLSGYGFGPLTFALIVISVAVFILSKFGYETDSVMGLFITEYERDGDYIRWAGGLPEVWRGQVWRVFTPMFVHFGILHIVFNMLWLRDLGSMIEGRQSSWFLGIQVLVIAGVSNVAQYYFAHGPNFGGMSGVVYGLLGYVWIRGKFDPLSGLFLHPTTVMMMIIWFVAGVAGVLGNMANVAHGAGLLLGMGWGYLAAVTRR